jgi:hypothetical protein
MEMMNEKTVSEPYVRSDGNSIWDNKTNALHKTGREEIAGIGKLCKNRLPTLHSLQCLIKLGSN